MWEISYIKVEEIYIPTEEQISTYMQQTYGGKRYITPQKVHNSIVTGSKDNAVDEKLEWNFKNEVRWSINSK